MQRYTSVKRIATVSMLLLISAACGGGGGGGDKSVLTSASGLELLNASNELPLRGTPQRPGFEELKAALMAVFEQLGIDPEKVAAAAPKGPANSVFDLEAELIDPDGPGGFEPVSGINLAWTERFIGDYDMNGEVNVADLTPLGIYFLEAVAYDLPEEHGGIEHWPMGDPDSDGAFNWRLARIDGDGNGELNIADVTPIGIHWRESLSAYRVYRRGPGEETYSMLPNPSDGSLPYTLGRPPTDPDGVPRYFFADSPEVDGLYHYYVAAYHLADDSEGAPGNVVEVALNTAPPPNAEPEAAISVSPAEVYFGLPVSFDASASLDPDGTIERYEWDFEGDGIFDQDSGTEATLEYLYQRLGSFEPVVRVTDNRGATALASTAVAIVFPPNNPPDAVFTAVPVHGNLVDEAPLPIVFDATGSSDPDGNGLLFYWDYDGNGSYDEIRPTAEAFIHNYEKVGDYTPVLKVQDSHPGSNLTDIAEFDGVITALPNQPPIAAFTADPLVSEFVPSDVTFDPSPSTDPSREGAIVLWEWDLDGDREFETTRHSLTTVVHTYSEPRAFVRVSLRITDNGGAQDTISQVITLPYIEGWQLNEIYQWSGAGLYTSAIYVEDKAAVAFQIFGQGLYYVRTDDPYGVTWGEIIKVDGRTDSQPFAYGRGQYNNMFLLNGRPAIIYYEDSAGAPGVPDPMQIRMCRALDPLGDSWEEPRTLYGGLNNFSGHVNAAFIGGNPAVTWRNWSDAAVYYARSLDSDGNAWPAPVLVSAQQGWEPAMMEGAAGPLLCYVVQQENEEIQHVVHANDGLGESWGEPADAHTGRFAEMQPVNGNPSIIFQQHSDFQTTYETTFIRADDAAGTAWTDRNVFGAGHNRGAGFAIIDGLPAVSFVAAGPEALIYIKAIDANGSDWDVPEVVLTEVTGQDAGWCQLLPVGPEGKQPMIIFRRREGLDNDKRGLFSMTYFPPPDGP